MSQFELSAALEECIKGLQSGADLEKVLLRYPDHVAELRPLLQTAAWMRNANQEIVVPRTAQARSRMEFLSRSSQPAPGHWFWFNSLRVAVTLVIFAILIVGLLGSGLASVSALPGDTFYPVKIAIEQAQINFSSDPSQRITLMESYDQRRAAEVNQLKPLGRFVQVSFAGNLDKVENQWEVADVLLVLTPDQALQLPNWHGVTVEVSGLSDGNTVVVQDIHPRLIEFTARLQQLTDAGWVAGGIQVNLTNTTHFDGSPVLGSNLDIIAGRLEDGQLVAIKVTVLGPNLPEDTNLPTMIFPSLTSGRHEEESTGSGTATVEPVATDVPQGGEETQSSSPLPPQPTSTPDPTHIDREHHENTPTPTAYAHPTATRQSTSSGDGDHEVTQTSDSTRSTPTPTPTPTPHSEASSNP